VKLFHKVRRTYDVDAISEIASHAVAVVLPSGLKLKAITAPYFLGNKIEAFRGRGGDDRR
jgi:hypothetical protein